MACRLVGAIFWTNAEILLIGTLGTNVNQLLIEIHNFHSIQLNKIQFKTVYCFIQYKYEYYIAW